MSRRARPLARLEEHPEGPMRRDRWPATLPPVRQLLDDGIDLAPVTVLVGDNGVGKSTIVEGLAAAYGINPQGGSSDSLNETRITESDLHEHLLAVRNPGGPRGGFFLRAEMMHGLFTYLEEHPSTHRADPVFHERSHGESFLDYVIDRSQWTGLWILDEPESALSFQSCLQLIAVLQSIVDDGRGQVVLSTHSPVLAAFPGALLCELGDWGIRHVAYDELQLVRNWRAFLAAPERYLRTGT
jgi:predicted ATPase